MDLGNRTGEGRWRTVVKSAEEGTANPAIQACTQTEPASVAESSVLKWWVELVLAFPPLVVGIRRAEAKEQPPQRQRAPVRG